LSELACIHYGAGCVSSSLPSTLTGGAERESSDMRFEYIIVINQPVEKVFDYVSNPLNLPEWQGPPTEIRDLQQTTPAQLREGDRFTTVLQFLSRRYETPTEVTTYEPNRRLSYRGTGGPVSTQITFMFEEVPGGTRFTHSQEVEPRGFFGLAESLFEIEAKRQLRNDLKTLKSLLEANG
jgi:uncharacterized protein YndB with AHSA1/START domain